MPKNFLSVFDHFVGLALNGLKTFNKKSSISLGSLFSLAVFYFLFIYLFVFFTEVKKGSEANKGSEQAFKNYPSHIVTFEANELNI